MDILEGDKARNALLNGASTMARIVGASIGPMGKNVIFDAAPAYPTYPSSSRDGVTIARQVRLNGHNATGAKMVREAAERTVQEAGDGTSATTILAHAIFAAGLKALESGKSVVAVKNEIERDVKIVCEFVSKMSVKLSGKMLDQVAQIAANNDPELGKLIADATRQAGVNGIVAVEDSGTRETTIERIEGMQFDRGFISPGFVNNSQRQICELINPLILLLDRPLTAIQPLIPLMEQVGKSGRPILILAEDITGAALTFLAQNKMAGILESCAVKLPSNLGHRKDLLLDIAAVTSGVAVIQELGGDLTKLQINHLGKAKKAVITSNNTRIIDGAGLQSAIDKRKEEIYGLLGQNPTTIEAERLRERLAKLSGGITMLRLGASSGLELGDVKARVEDACYSTRQALEGGIVPGCGMALARASKQLPEGIIKSAILQPALNILANAGISAESLNDVLKIDSPHCGINALTGDMKIDLIEQGVLDPTRVITAALQNAASVAKTMLLTECICQETPKE